MAVVLYMKNVVPNKERILITDAFWTIYYISHNSSL